MLVAKLHSKCASVFKLKDASVFLGQKANRECSGKVMNKRSSSNIKQMLIWSLIMFSKWAKHVCIIFRLKSWNHTFYWEILPFPHWTTLLWFSPKRIEGLSHGFQDTLCVTSCWFFPSSPSVNVWTTHFSHLAVKSVWGDCTEPGRTFI